jgi:hypothetical protein
MNEEGWYQDPFELHEARWISDGKPTALVRDGDTESQDAAPSKPPRRPLVEAQPPPSGSPSDDLRRADDPNAGVPPDYSAVGEVSQYWQQH